MLLIMSSGSYSMDPHDLNSKNYLINADGSRTHIHMLILLKKLEQLELLLDAGADPNALCILQDKEISLIEFAISIGSRDAAKILYDRGASKPDKEHIIGPSGITYEQVILWYDDEFNDANKQLQVPLAEAFLKDNWEAFRALLNIGVIPHAGLVHCAKEKKEAIKILHEIAQNPVKRITYPKRVMDLIEEYYAKSIQDEDDNNNNQVEIQPANNLDDAAHNAREDIQRANGLNHAPHANAPVHDIPENQLNWRARIISKKSIFVGLTIVTLGSFAYTYITEWLNKRTKNKKQSEQKAQ